MLDGFATRKAPRAKASEDASPAFMRRLRHARRKAFLIVVVRARWVLVTFLCLNCTEFGCPTKSRCPRDPSVVVGEGGAAYLSGEGDEAVMVRIIALQEDDRLL